METEHVTTEAIVGTFGSANGVFGALLLEIRELSKKKPEATLSKSKVKLINAVLVDLLSVLVAEPEGKYLQLLEDDELPQVSDALMMMVQFHAASSAFDDRYNRFVEVNYDKRAHFWMTKERLKKWKEDGTVIVEP